MAAALASRFSRGTHSLLGGLCNVFSGLMKQQQQQQRRTFIQMGTMLQVADNSGAKKVMCIQSLTKKKGAKLGDTIVTSVKETTPKSKVKKGQVVYGLVVRAAMQKGRVDGSQVKFDDNAVVLLYAMKMAQGVRRRAEKKYVFGPVGSRVFGPIPHEIRKNKHFKVLALSRNIV